MISAARHRHPVGLIEPAVPAAARLAHAAVRW
jgi:hypothetical protein